MIKIILLLVISQVLGLNSTIELKPVSEVSKMFNSTIKLKPVSEVSKMEKLKSVVEDLLYVVRNSIHYDVLKVSLRKFQQLDKERNSFFKSRPNKKLTLDEMEIYFSRLINIAFKYSDIIHNSIISEKDQLDYEKIFIDNKLIKPLELLKFIE